MDRYTARINLMGTTQRERELNRLKQSILKDSQASLSYKVVTLNGVNSHLMIDSNSSNPYIKEIKSLPNEKFNTGDYVVWSGATWLITKSDLDDEVYVDGQMELTNHTLKFQSTTGTMLSYPCINETSKSIGIDENNTLTTPNSLIHIKLPFDANTVLINTDRRFFIDDLSVEIPQVFFVSKPNRTEFKFGNKGLIELTMTQDSYNSQTDRKDLGVCNYFVPIVEPPIPDPDIPTEIVTITSDAVNNNIKLGLLYTFSATFKNELGIDVDNVISQYSINNNYGNLVVLVNNGDGTCTVQVNEDAYDILTSECILRCYDAAHGFEAFVTLTIVGLF